MKERTRKIVFCCSAVGLALCVVLLGITLWLQAKDKAVQQALLDSMASDSTVDAAQDDTPNDTQEDTAQDEAYLETLAGFYAENNDFVGWVCAEGTEINYPVMHTPDDEEYYLHTDFYGGYSVSGTIFASANSTFALRSDNVILYGHNMGNGTMFADLLNYTSAEYWQAHSVIQFDTVTQAQSYEIVYAFVVDVGDDQQHFAFYDFINAADEQAFDDFVAQCKACSLYDMGNDPVYGDALLTLVTCKGYDTTERMVVVAKAVDVT